MAVMTPFFDIVAGVAILAGRSSLLDAKVFQAANTNITLRQLLALGFIGYGGWNLWKVEKAQDKLKESLEAESFESEDWSEKFWLVTTQVLFQSQSDPEMWDASALTEVIISEVADGFGQPGMSRVIVQELDTNDWESYAADSLLPSASPSETNLWEVTLQVIIRSDMDVSLWPTDSIMAEVERLAELGEYRVDVKKSGRWDYFGAESFNAAYLQDPASEYGGPTEMILDTCPVCAEFSNDMTPKELWPRWGKADDMGYMCDDCWDAMETDPNAQWIYTQEAESFSADERKYQAVDVPLGMVCVLCENDKPATNRIVENGMPFFLCHRHWFNYRMGAPNIDADLSAESFEASERGNLYWCDDCGKYMGCESYGEWPSNMIITETEQELCGACYKKTQNAESFNAEQCKHESYYRVRHNYDEWEEDGDRFCTTIIKCSDCGVHGRGRTNLSHEETPDRDYTQLWWEDIGYEAETFSADGWDSYTVSYMEEEDDPHFEVDDDYDDLNEAMSAYQHFINTGMNSVMIAGYTMNENGDYEEDSKPVAEYSKGAYDNRPQGYSAESFSAESRDELIDTLIEIRQELAREEGMEDWENESEGPLDSLSSAFIQELIWYMDGDRDTWDAESFDGSCPTLEDINTWAKEYFTDEDGFIAQPKKETKYYQGDVGDEGLWRGKKIRIVKKRTDDERDREKYWEGSYIIVYLDEDGNMMRPAGRGSKTEEIINPEDYTEWRDSKIVLRKDLETEWAPFEPTEDKAWYVDYRDYPTTIVDTISEKLGFGVLGGLNKWGSQQQHPENLFMQLAEQKQNGVFVLLSYGLDEYAAFLYMGKMHEGKVVQWNEYDVGSGYQGETWVADKIGTHPLTDKSGIAWDEIGNWVNPDHPFQTGKWREAYDSEWVIDEEIEMVDLNIGGMANSWLWFCPPDALESLGKQGVMNWGHKNIESFEADTFPSAEKTWTTYNAEQDSYGECGCGDHDVTDDDYDACETCATIWEFPDCTSGVCGICFKVCEQCNPKEREKHYQTCTLEG